MTYKLLLTSAIVCAAAVAKARFPLECARLYATVAAGLQAAAHGSLSQALSSTSWASRVYGN